MFPPQGHVKAVDTRVATVIVAADGSGDYTDIQEGINALPASGGVVYIKDGTYVVDAEIYTAKNNVSIIGAGWSTVIKVGDNTNVRPVFNIDGSNFTLKNLQIDGNKANNTWSAAAWLNNINNIVENCLIKNCAKAETLSCYDYSIVSNNIFVDNKAGPDFYGYYGIFENNIVLNTVANMGLYMYDYCIAIGNYFGNCNDYGIRSDNNSNIIISSNIVDGSSSHGIYVPPASPLSNSVIEQNRVVNCGGYGIYIGSGDRNIIVGNQVYGNTSGGIYDAGTNTQIAHNIE